MTWFRDSPREMTIENFEKDILPLKQPIYRFALYLVKNQEDARDIAQEVLIKMWEKRQGLDKVENYRAWALKITRNKCLDLFKSARRKNVDWNETLDKKTATTPLNILDTKDQTNWVKTQMEMLPELQKEIFYMRHFEENTYQEIGESLNIDESKVKVYLHRARVFIKQSLEQKNDHGLKTG